MNFAVSLWTDKDCEGLREFLKSNAELKYKNFQASLIPAIDKDYIFGVKMDVLRKVGKEISKGNPKSFLENSFREYYEERMLRGIVTGCVKPIDFEDFCLLCDGYISDVENWALCDSFCSGLKYTKVYKQEFFDYIPKYLDSDSVWKKRVGIVLMLDYYIEDEFIDRVFERCDKINTDFYYVSMAVAWLISSAFVKCEEKTRRYLEKNSLDNATFNRAIQKCLESRRISAETKKILKMLKRS